MLQEAKMHFVARGKDALCCQRQRCTVLPEANMHCVARGKDALCCGWVLLLAEKVGLGLCENAVHIVLGQSLHAWESGRLVEVC